MLNCQDRKFVEEGLKFWTEQVAKNPRNKLAKFNLQWFQDWAKDLGL